MAKHKRAESRTRYFIRNQATKRGWNIQHPNKHGDCLEEQEIINHLTDIGLGLEKPDFLFLLNQIPCMIIEAKNEVAKIEQAVQQAIDYAEKINSGSPHRIRIVVGVAGEEDLGFSVVVRFLHNGDWKPLTSLGYEITTIPSKQEIELALEAGNATTSVTVPSSAEFIDAAIELSGILRLAKIEAPLRPKVIGAIVLALYQGEIDSKSNQGLASINQLVNDAINEALDLDHNKKSRLQEALKLISGDFDRLEPFISLVVSILKRLNVRSVLHTSIDFLGLFYEAFLRYGYDNNALGIVFTPRHITKFCVELTGAGATDRAIDIASGTGGFLVAAFDKMMANASGPKAIAKVKQSLYGLDTNPTVWALATLNMFFRGDGKSHIENQSCFEKNVEQTLFGKFTRAYLNPPFSQIGEPERRFIDVAMECLEPEGILAVVVKAGIFADEDNRNWRREFIRNHTLLGVISLPEDLFYPTAAPTSIMIAKAHIPQRSTETIFMGRIWNDGFEKLKGRRVEIGHSQIPDILQSFENFRKGKYTSTSLVSFIKGIDILDGEEFSPQQWLEQPPIKATDTEHHHEKIVYSVYQAIATLPELADIVLENFAEPWMDNTPLEYNKTASLDHFFEVITPTSIGEKNYLDGSCPFISSGDALNSIVRLIHEEPGEVIKTGGITVTAFGQAYLQPWAFMARGNGGSAVRVLVPKFQMTVNEMIWFASQINLQRWRFFYGRMAIKSRISKLSVSSPLQKIDDVGDNLRIRAGRFRDELYTLSRLK
jgi:type I restriction-modification system DNA methylase subunit